MLLINSVQAQLCSACQSFAMAHISATIIFRIKVRNKQFEAKQTSWMLTRSITRALQTRIPILGSEGQMCKTLLSWSCSSCSWSSSSSCAAEALINTSTSGERSQTLRGLPISVSPYVSNSHMTSCVWFTTSEHWWFYLLVRNSTLKLLAPFCCP